MFHREAKRKLNGNDLLERSAVASYSKMLFLVLVILTLSLEVQSFPCNSGTTPRLKEIVMGRCWSYTELKKLTAINCTALWEAFYDGFAFKDHCNVKTSDYEAFFDVGDKQDIVNKSLFWSGTYKAVHAYSDFDLRFTTLEDTLEGSMMNDLCWCGSTSDGIDYKSCPNDCAGGTLNSTYAFWALASKKFAERARGVVRVMVNGTRFDRKGNPIPAYTNSSFFGHMELPNFKVPTIVKLQILVVHTIGKDKRESCGTGSINKLKRDAENRNIKVECVNDPFEVKHILCSYASPNTNECKFLDDIKPDCRTWKIIVIILAVLLFVAILAVVVFVSIQCKKRQYHDNP